MDEAILTPTNGTGGTTEDTENGGHSPKGDDASSSHEAGAKSPITLEGTEGDEGETGDNDTAPPDEALLDETHTDDPKTKQAEKGENPAGFHKVAHRRSYNDLGPDKLLATMKEKTKTFHKRAETLKTKAKELEERTGAKVYLIIEYQDAHSKTHHYEHGQSFSSNKEKPAKQVCVTDVRDASSQGESGDTASNHGQPPSQSTSSTTSQPSTHSAADELFQSPKVIPQTVPRRRISSGVGCMRCGHVDSYVVLGTQRAFSPFFYCTIQGCKGKVHSDCIGFPTYSGTDVHEGLKWYCDIHRGAGRGPVLVDAVSSEDHAGVETEDTPAQETAAEASSGSQRRSSSRGKNKGDKAAAAKPTEKRPRGRPPKK